MQSSWAPFTPIGKTKPRCRQGTFLPFGQELNPQATTNHYKFSGKERDAEDGLDYFGARYYSSTMGRWMSGDWSATPEPVPYADFSDPQTLNLYTYVRDLPTTRVDKDGHCDWCEKLGNWLDGNGLVTNSELTEQHRQWLVDQASNDSDKKRIEDEKDPNRINGTYNCLHNPICTGQFKQYVQDIAKAAAVLTPGVQKTLESIDQTGKNLPNQAGGQMFQNREGLLPDKDASGNTITYKKWDTEPSKQLGQARTGQRLVTGSDGSAYLTDSHYASFTRIR